jgi:hypothetical protein
MRVKLEAHLVSHASPRPPFSAALPLVVDQGLRDLVACAPPRVRSAPPRPGRALGRSRIPSAVPIQGTFVVIQGTFVTIQGTFGAPYSTHAIIQEVFSFEGLEFRQTKIRLSTFRHSTFDIRFVHSRAKIKGDGLRGKRSGDDRCIYNLKRPTTK